MKSFLLSTILGIVVWTNSFSQYASSYDYSIALKVYSNMQMPKVFNQNTERYINSYFKGGMIRFNDNQIGLRLTGYYLKQAMRFTDDCLNCDLADGRVTDYAFKLGFEKNLNYARLQPYFGIDLGYRNNAFAGKMNAIDLQQNVAAVKRIEATKRGITTGPVAGLKINLLPMVTLFAEGSLEIFYSYERRHTVALNAGSENTFNKTYQTDFLLNPVTVGLQLHLSRKD